jgi:hypothetical protein
MNVAPGPSIAEQGEFLARCVAGTSGNPALEQIRDKGADAVLALYRMVKIARIHSFENDAVVRTIDQSYGVLSEFAALAGGTASVTFVNDAVFVCGQLLRASRMIYEAAAELGALLGRCNVSEVSFTAETTREALAALCAAVEAALRDPSAAAALVEKPIPGITVRRVESLLTQREQERDNDPEGRFLRLYASALVVLRRFFDGVAAGSQIVPHRVKRLAQAFVNLAETGDSGLLGLTTLANAHRDDAGRAVQSAILALALGRQITTDRVALSRLAMAAMLADIGRVRIAGPEGRDRLVALGDEDDAAVPSVTSALCISIGGVNAQSALRTVVLHEAMCLEREGTTGASYDGGTAPLLQSRILQLVRALLVRLAPRDTSRPMSILDALQDVTRIPSIDRGLVRMLLAAVGLTPTGSVVELETGEWAVVVGRSANLDAHDRPRIRVVMDRRGNVIEPPREIDLGAPPAGHSLPRIQRIVEPQEARFNVARVFTPKVSS